MGFPSIIAGAADLFQYKRNTATIAAASALILANCTSATEEPDAKVEGATRIQPSTAYNLSVVFYGANVNGGYACTVPPTNLAFTPAAGHNTIKVTVTAPAYTTLVGLFVNDALAGVATTPLACRNGAAASTEVVVYYEPSAKAPTRSQITAAMTGVTVYGFDRVNFAETTGDTSLSLEPTTVQIQRNSGSDIVLVTGFTVRCTATLLASGKKDMADLVSGICTKAGGLKTKQEAVFGHRGLGLPSARPVEIVGPGESAGKEDSLLIFSALKISDQAITKTWSKNNPSQLPITFISADDDLLKGIHGTMSYFEN